MSQQHQKWIQLVKDKLISEGMTQTHLARSLWCEETHNFGTAQIR